MTILLLVSTANTAVLLSLVSKASVSLFVVVWDHAEEYTDVSLFPVLLFGQLAIR